MKRNHPTPNVSEETPLPSDSDEDEYEDMSTQKLKKMIDEGGLSQTTTGQLLTIFVKKVDERDAKYEKDMKGSTAKATTAVVPTSRMKAIREAVKERISFEGKDEDLVKDPRFKVAMESLEKNPITTTFDDVTLTVIWDKQRSRVGFHNPTPFTKHLKGKDVYKCQLDFCWLDENSRIWNFCKSHCPVNAYFVWDIKADVTTIAIVTPMNPKIGGYNNSDLQTYSKSKTAESVSTCLYNYMNSHKDSKTDLHVAVLRSFSKFEYSTEDFLAGEGNHHNMVAMSIMTMLYNSTCDVKDRVIFLNQDIYFRNRDGFQKNFFLKLKQVFEINGFIFKFTGEKKSTILLPNSLHPTVSYENLPSSYLARDNNTGEIYSGLKYEMRRKAKGQGSSTHTKGKKTALSDFDKTQIKRIYQFGHPQANLIKDKLKYTKLSKEEKEIHDEMKEKAERVETMGHMASLLAEILGLKINGRDIDFLCQKFSHFDDAYSKSVFRDIFGYLYGEVIEVEIPTMGKDDDGKIVWKFVK
ncbi:uncharacterized protein LOC110858663 isoform X2 [Folsomia candida]|uniref:uncharacterized protein LOC110858663 isoform X2 n=1 Tax=Folsomia candida TaxID=158441 RepID=UPI000B8FA557|nr:uncharacterized protein LOC110858663 isoform X2 [Folsomia candida]